METKKRYEGTIEYFGTQGNAALKPEEYTSGNTAREFPYRQEEEREERQSGNGRAKRTARNLKPVFQNGINVWSMLLLVAAIAITMYTSFGYLNIQADIVVVNKNIANLESRLENLQVRNEAAYNAVVTAVDFDEVYRVAVGELGMVFPNKSTVLKYNVDAEGYVRQYADIPEADRLNILKELLPLR